MQEKAWGKLTVVLSTESYSVVFLCSGVLLAQGHFVALIRLDGDLPPPSDISRKTFFRKTPGWTVVGRLRPTIPSAFRSSPLDWSRNA